MAIWAKTSNSESRPKSLPMDSNSPHSREFVTATTKGWVMQPGTASAATGNDNVNADPEILICIRNLSSLGINYPIIVNTGLKGRAIQEIKKLVNNTCFFIDDNPYQIESAAETNPSIYRFHFTACKLVKKTMPFTKSATHRPNSWEEVVTLINDILSN